MEKNYFNCLTFHLVAHNGTKSWTIRTMATVPLCMVDYQSRTHLKWAVLRIYALNSWIFKECKCLFILQRVWSHKNELFLANLLNRVANKFLNFIRLSGSFACSEINGFWCWWHTQRNHKLNWKQWAQTKDNNNNNGTTMNCSVVTRYTLAFNFFPNKISWRITNTLE